MLLLGRYHGLEHRERLPTDDGIGSGAASDSRACRGIIFDTCCAAACTSAAGKSRYACAQLCRWSLSYYRLVYSTVRLARLYCRREDAAGRGTGACASRVCLFLSGASSCLAPCVRVRVCGSLLVCGLPRLRVPGVSPLTARARLLTRCYYCWLAVGPKVKRPIYRSWLDRSLLACFACRCWVS